GVLAAAKPALWSRVLERLVRTLSVVVGHPLIESLLRCLQVSEHLPGVELDAQAAVETLDLARRGRRAGLGEDVVNAVLPADAVEQHFDRRLSKAPSEHHAVVRQDLRRYSIFAQR